jgi:hypothetical protein
MLQLAASLQTVDNAFTGLAKMGQQLQLRVQATSI